MDLRKLKKLIDLVKESGIEELEITEGEERVRINSGNKAAMASVASPLVAPIQVDLPRQAEELIAPSDSPSSPADEGFNMKSPMVGTFYRRQTLTLRRSSNWGKQSLKVKRCALSKQ